MKTMARLWIGLTVLVVLCPLGLILPAKLGAGSAWGEWSADAVGKLVGYQPSGMQRLADVWKAPLPDYALKGQESAPLHALSISYIISGLLGGAVTVGITLLLGKALARRESSDAA